MKCSRDQLSTLLRKASVLRFERRHCIAYLRFIDHSEANHVDPIKETDMYDKSSGELPDVQLQF